MSPGGRDVHAQRILRVRGAVAGPQTDGRGARGGEGPREAGDDSRRDRGGVLRGRGVYRPSGNPPALLFKRLTPAVERRKSTGFALQETRRPQSNAAKTIVASSRIARSTAQVRARASAGGGPPASPLHRVGRLIKSRRGVRGRGPRGASAGPARSSISRRVGFTSKVRRDTPSSAHNATALGPRAGPRDRARRVERGRSRGVSGRRRGPFGVRATGGGEAPPGVVRRARVPPFRLRRGPFGARESARPEGLRGPLHATRDGSEPLRITRARRVSRGQARVRAGRPQAPRGRGRGRRVQGDLAGRRRAIFVALVRAARVVKPQLGDDGPAPERGVPVGVPAVAREP